MIIHKTASRSRAPVPLRRMRRQRIPEVVEVRQRLDPWRVVRRRRVLANRGLRGRRRGRRGQVLDAGKLLEQDLAAGESRPELGVWLPLSPRHGRRGRDAWDVGLLSPGQPKTMSRV